MRFTSEEIENLETLYKAVSELVIEIDDEKEIEDTYWDDDAEEEVEETIDNPDF
jgi:hypothetical protein